MAGGEGSVFGKYFLLKKIASGGMGEIYLAKLKGPVGFEKLLVIKRILQHHLENQEFVDMFFAEARVAAQLTHSNVVQIYEMGEIEDCYYIGMEYVHGKSLRDLLDRARNQGEYLHPAHAIEIIGKLSAGVSYAHNATNMSGEAIGVIHRDINPHNILVSYSGEVKMIDFGIAKSQMQQHKTETGTIKGKFVYMSPEQSAAEPLDKRSDIFSVGICLYETLTFVNPFAKANVVLSLDAIQRHDAPPLTQTNPRLGVLDEVVSRALAKRADDRFDDCIDLRDALYALRDDSSIEDPPQNLADFMHDLFAEQIEHEKRMILETDSANTSQIQLMQQGLEREHQSDSHGGARMGSGQIAAHASPVALAEPMPHSRLPFMFTLLAIIVLSGVAATVVYTLVERDRMGQTPIFQVPTSPSITPPPPSLLL
ncbi:serine/threonine protein kinase [Myxococcota bacterium]